MRSECGFPMASSGRAWWIKGGKSEDGADLLWRDPDANPGRCRHEDGIVTGGLHMQKSTTPKPAKSLTFEAAFGELQEVVAALEGEPRSLEEAMSLFERGQALVKRCTELLDQAELKVKRLSGGELTDLEEE